MRDKRIIAISELQQQKASRNIQTKANMMARTGLDRYPAVFDGSYRGIDAAKDHPLSSYLRSRKIRSHIAAIHRGLTFFDIFWITTIHHYHQKERGATSSSGLYWAPLATSRTIATIYMCSFLSRSYDNAGWSLAASTPPYEYTIHSIQIFNQKTA